MKKPKTEKPPQALAQPYQPTPQEQRALEAFRSEKKDEPPRPRLTVSKGAGPLVISFDHPDNSVASILLSRSLGSTDHAFNFELLHQLSGASVRGAKPDENALNFMLAVIDSVSPRDNVEAMMAAQMAAVHSAAMTFARRLANVDHLAQQDSAERAFNKLTRTFAMQMEALKRYRTGGEQTVTVQHVHVNDGGQAIVGAVQGVGTAAKPATTP